MKHIIAECTDYDYKIALEEKKPRSWLKTVVAFANGVGGSLFFGVDDNGAIVGLEDIKHVSEKISEFIKARISPLPIYELVPAEDGANKYLELAVYAGTSTPYYYDFDGVKEAYIRSGNQTIPAPSHILSELVLKGANKTFDALPTTYKKSDYSFTFFEATFLERTHTHVTEDDYASFNLVDKNGNLTNAGVLLADQNIYIFNRVFCTRWNGLDKTSLDDDAIDDAEFSGSVVKLLDSTLDFVKRNTKKRWRKEAAGRVEMPEYDELAVREALVNAFIHRMYTIPGAEVSLNIYDDRLEVVSPGGMMSGDKIDGTVKEHIPSMRRNPFLADVFARMNFMERRGSGLKKITDRTNTLFNDNENHVEFFSDNSFFTVVIHNANYKLKTDDTLNDTLFDTLFDAILDLIRQDGGIGINDIATKLNKSRATISRAIKKLKDDGVLVREGSKKTGRWKILK